MTVLSLQVDDGNDDAFEYTNGVMDLSAFNIVMGHISIGRHSGYRFTGVTGLGGSTVTAATLTFRAAFGDTGNFVGDWYADDRVDPPAFTSATDDITNRTRTSATCEGDGVDFGDWTAGADETFNGPAPGIMGIIQELADSYDPGEIALLHIYGSSYGERVVSSYESSSSTAPKLGLTFTPGGPSPVTGQASLIGAGSLAAVAGLTTVASAVLSGVGSVVAAGTTGAIRTGAAVLSGVGSLTPGTPVLTLVGQASFLGEGSLVAVGERGALGAVALAGVGDMSAIGEIGGTLEGRADLAGVGSLAAIAQRIVAGQVAFAGAGSMSATGALVLTGVVTLAGVGTLTAIGESGAILYTQMGKRVYEFDASVDYPPDTLFYFEATLEVLVGANKTAAARLYNVTDAGEVVGSELLIPGPGPAWDRSSSFSLPSGVKRYRIEYGGTSGGEYKPHGAALRVESS